MKFALAAVTFALSATSAAHAGGGNDMVTYKRFGALGGTNDGYREKDLGDGTWQVTSIIRAAKSPSSASKMALYRAAELAERSSFKYVKIISVNDKKIFNSISPVITFTSGHKSKIVFSFTNTPAPQNHCSANVDVPCVTYDAKAALAEIRPILIINQGT